MAKRPTLSLREANVSLIDCVHRTPPAVSSGYPYITIPEIRNGRIDHSKARRVSHENYIAWTAKAAPQAYDVVLSRRCNPGETAFVPQGLQFALGQNLVLLRADGTKVFPPFLRWLVRGHEWWEQVGKFNNVGAVFDSLKCADIPNFELPIPTLTEQRAIASILGNLDDKIELNCRINETLETTARAIFKSWYVDFDPVRAKAAGRQPLGMNAETVALFPSSFEDSPLGKIPQGWTTPNLGEIVDFAYGKALKEENRRQGKVPVYGSNGPVGWHDEAFVKGPGIIVGRKGNPGTVTWAPTDFVPIDTTFYVALKPALTSLLFAFHSLSLLDLPSLGADSAVPGLNRNIAYMSRVLLPRTEMIKAFDSLCGPLSLRVHLNNEESRTLAAIRDALLPKLISGEIRIKDAEKMIGERV